MTARPKLRCGGAERIEHSLVLNLCLRRACHDVVDSFPDYHLFRREADRLCPEADVFYQVEDQFYNEAVTRRFRGVALRAETVEYRRHPGNAYDRQYEKFRRPRANPRTAPPRRSASACAWPRSFSRNG